MLKVTLVRSAIKKPKRQKDTLLALGLKKINQTVEHDDVPTIRGMIERVNHLVKVENA